MVVFSNNSPLASRTTILQPVLNPGSIPKTTFCPKGADNSNCLRLSENTSMAAISAFSLDSCLNSVSIDGLNNLS